MNRADTQARWRSIWTQRGWFARLLWPLSWLYGVLLRLRRRGYLTHPERVARLPVPVIVVGNYVVGGAGKTPTVLALLQHLKASGWTPGVVSRGYGRASDEVLELTTDTTAMVVGDEPLLIQQRANVPVFVGRQRADAARKLLSTHPDVDVVVCDDGLQHLALGRDIAIAVFDDRGTGNGWLLPAGLLREPWPPQPDDPFAPHIVLRQDRHATAPHIVLRQDRHATAPPHLVMPASAEAFSASRRLADHAVGANGQRRPLESLRNQVFTAVAGVARPDVFFAMLREQGLAAATELPLPDHAPTEDFALLRQSPSITVVCTEKDAVKLSDIVRAWPESKRPSVWAVPLRLDVEPGFFEAVDRLLRRPDVDARLSLRHGYQTP